MTQLWRQLYDLTYPVTSMFSGAGFNHMIRETFGEDSQMEDLWLPYFTITTDITSSSMRLHTHGIVWTFLYDRLIPHFYLSVCKAGVVVGVFACSFFLFLSKQRSF